MYLCTVLGRFMSRIFMLNCFSYCNSLFRSVIQKMCAFSFVWKQMLASKWFQIIKDTDFFVKQIMLWKVKKLNFESSTEVLRELRSLYKIYQVHSMLDLDLKNGVNPLKTWPSPSSQSLAFLPRKAEPLPPWRRLCFSFIWGIFL